MKSDHVAVKLIHIAAKIHNEVRFIYSTPSVSLQPKSLDDVLFQHHSPLELATLTPQTYDSIMSSRGKDYIESRILEEDLYKTQLGLNDNRKSFTYATVVGFNNMESAEAYPGFTYFFKLMSSDIDKTLFGVIDKTFELSIEPQRGFGALTRCLSHWNKHRTEFRSYEEKFVGLIEPRVEVIIPYNVNAEFCIPEIEQR